MSPPTPRDKKAAINTPAALTSFASLPFGDISRLIKSIKDSIAVFKSSKINTSEITTKRTAHSNVDMLKYHAAMKANSDRKMCVLKLGSCLIAEATPSNACEKLAFNGYFLDITNSC